MEVLPMKKLLSVLLTLTMLFSLCVPAFATEDEQPTPVATVNTLADLQDAIAAANVGDTITVSSPITVSGESLITDKQIVIAVSDDFPSSDVLTLYDGAGLEGFTFVSGVENHNIVAVNSEDTVTIRNCTFTADGLVTHISIFGSFTGGLNNARIESCRFENAENHAIDIRAAVNATIENCSFSNNSAPSMWGGAICNSGTLLVSDTTITENTTPSGGGIGNDGTLTLSNCRVSGNTANVGYGADIFSMGHLSITDEAQADYGFYDETTGDKVTLPLTDK
jgi:hypothetical protein